MLVRPTPISFSEAERLSQIFDAENREEWQRTPHILQVLDLQPDTVIADVGAAGFQVQEMDLVSCPDHYILRFGK